MTHIISPRSILYYIASDIFREQKTWATGMSSLWTSLFRERARGSPCHPAIEAPRIRFGWKRSLKHISRSLLPKSIFVFAHEFIPDLPITSYPKIPHHTKRNSNVSLWRYNTKFDCPRCIVVFKCMIPQSETTAETRSREVSLKNGKVSDKKKCVSLVLFETSVGWKQSYNQIHSPSIWLWTWSFKSTSSETGRLWWRINPRNSSTSWHVACLGIAFWNHWNALADFRKKQYTNNVNAVQ